MKQRERWLVDTVVDLAGSLVSDYDANDLLRTLTERSVQLLGAAEVGIVIVDERENMRAVASSTERMHALELLELQSDEGPCLDCVRSGRAVDADLLTDAAAARWPRFVAAATGAGYQQVHALPMRVHDVTVGAVNVLSDDRRPISTSDLSIVQALADIATVTIVQDRAVRESARLAEQLQGALDSRVVIEQAKGILAQHLDVPVDEAFTVLRSFARDHNHRLTDLAAAIAGRRVALDVFGGWRGSSLEVLQLETTGLGEGAEPDR